MLDKIRRWIARHPNWTLTFVTLATLAPFVAKPFNIDEPMFVWVARQIQAHPFDPYGFQENWYGTAMPMWENLWDPPVACYYLAVAAEICGWSEVAVHSAFLLPAVAVILGTFRLAKHFCNRPVLAALATLSTPVFLVSSTTVMCDVLMLAFWIWAVVFWIEGMECDNFLRLSAAGFLMGMAALTKHFGVCVIPLLALYSVMSKRSSARWAVCLLIPVAMLIIYQCATNVLYGHGLFFNAGSHVSFFKDTRAFSFLTTTLTALAFTGGCLAGMTFFAPLLWRAKTLAGFAAATAVFAVPLFLTGAFFEKFTSIQSPEIAVAIQIIFWAVGGAFVLALAFGEDLRRRDAQTWLLAFWIFGTFLFAAFFNWNVNGRAILPMAPAAGILLARRLEKNSGDVAKTGSRVVSICLVIGAVLALLVTRADYLFAKAVRQSAQETSAKYGNETLWFQGHWGFQYYMEQLGATPLDFARSPLKRGDHFALPVNNTNLLPPKPEMAKALEIFSVPGPRLLATMNQASGAGFYASVWGPLPFAFGRVTPEQVCVFVLLVEPPPSSN
jgi:4-amino-4-deoxy-L-arabinose transferase-like glycosyltransferase